MPTLLLTDRDVVDLLPVDSCIDIMADAPWAPVFNEQRFTMHAARIGGDPALFTDPIHIPVNYDYIFAKDAQ